MCLFSVLVSRLLGDIILALLLTHPSRAVLHVSDCFIPLPAIVQRSTLPILVLAIWALIVWMMTRMLFPPGNLRKEASTASRTLAIRG